jgi:hypothetical protein
MIPKYMEKWSKGPAVVVLLSFLVGWTIEWSKLPLDFKIGDELDDGGMKLVALYQTKSGISIDGGCGPEMRGDMLSQGFDFESAARANGGTTFFVQVDGTNIPWSPESDG